jgi:hypothetical protein
VEDSTYDYVISAVMLLSTVVDGHDYELGASGRDFQLSLCRARILGVYARMKSSYTVCYDGLLVRAYIRRGDAGTNLASGPRTAVSGPGPETGTCHPTARESGLL